MAVVGKAVVAGKILVARQVLFAILLSVFVSQILFGVLFTVGIRQFLLDGEGDQVVPYASLR